MNKIEFSHLPSDGICVGLTIVNDDLNNRTRLLVSAAFTNQPAGDQYNRAKARSIIRSRLERYDWSDPVAWRAVDNPLFVLGIPRNANIRSIALEFRKRYKPHPKPSRLRFNCTREEAWSEICDFVEFSVASLNYV